MYLQIIFSLACCLSKWTVLPVASLSLQAPSALHNQQQQQQQQQRDSQQRSTVFPNSRPSNQADRETLQRQTGQLGPAVAAIGVPKTCNCRHGFPQAFAMDPLPQTSGRINSGLLKLTCPLLVNAVDRLEDEGLITDYNQIISNSQPLQQSISNAHKVHGDVRHRLLFFETSHERDNSKGSGCRSSSSASEADVRMLLMQKLGSVGSQAFLEAGVAGSSPVSLDAKCLHAWLADYLFRGDSSALGENVVQDLQARGIDMTGTIDCSKYCGAQTSSLSRESLSSPPVARNKQRRKSQREFARRKRRAEDAVVDQAVYETRTDG